MSFRDRENERMLRMYQEETGIHDFVMADVARWANERGWQMPTPQTPEELLARQLQRTARTITREGTDVLPYRAYQCYTEVVNGETRKHWFDFDGPAATRSKVEKSLKGRLGQALDIAVHVKVDENRWNETHPDQKIQLDLDLTDEVTWRLNAPKDAEDEAA